MTLRHVGTLSSEELVLARQEAKRRLFRQFQMQINYTPASKENLAGNAF